MAGIWGAIEDTKSRISEIATLAYQGLMFAKDSSFLTFACDEDEEKDPQIYWVPQLAYERARGQLDAVQDLAITFLGATEARAVLSAAAKAVGYVPTTENNYSVHAAAMLASHTPSKETYQKPVETKRWPAQTNNSAQTGHSQGAKAMNAATAAVQRVVNAAKGSEDETKPRGNARDLVSTGGQSLIAITGGRDTKQDFGKASRGTGNVKTPLEEMEEYLQEEFDQMYESFCYYIMFGSSETSMDIINDDRKLNDLGPLTENQVIGWYSVNQSVVDCMMNEDVDMQRWFAENRSATTHQLSLPSAP